MGRGRLGWCPHCGDVKACMHRPDVIVQRAWEQVMGQGQKRGDDTVSTSKAKQEGACVFCHEQTHEAYTFPGSGRVQIAHDECRKTANRAKRAERAKGKAKA